MRLETSQDILCAPARTADPFATRKGPGSSLDSSLRPGARLIEGGPGAGIRAMIHRLLIGLLAGTLLCVAGCRQDGSPADGTEEIYPIADVDVSANDSAGVLGSASGLSRPQIFSGSFSAVTRVTVTVSGQDKYGVNQPALATANLTLAAGVWSGTIPGLAVGPTLTFTADGYTATNAHLFSGAVSQVMTGGANTVAAAMSPVDNGAPFNIPVVTSLPLPATLLRNTTVAIPIGVTGSPNETLSFAITPTTGGTFTPRTGTLALPASGTGTINTSYKAPGSTGTKTHTLTLTNSQTNALDVTFNIVVN